MLLEAEVSFLFTNIYKKKKKHHVAEFALKNTLLTSTSFFILKHTSDYFWRMILLLPFFWLPETRKLLH